MTGELTEIPFNEPDRTHRQAKTGLLFALRTDDEDLYRSMQDLEVRTRREKIRRQQARDGPDRHPLHPVEVSKS